MNYIRLLLTIFYHRLIHHELWYASWFLLLAWLAWLSWRTRTPDFFLLGFIVFTIADEVYLFGWGNLKIHDIIGYYWRDGRWYPSHELFTFTAILAWLLVWIKRLSQ